MFSIRDVQHNLKNRVNESYISPDREQIILSRVLSIAQRFR